MSKTIIEHEFDRGDKVFHITPDSPQGLIIEWRYSSRSKSVMYNVIFGPYTNEDVWCDEIELSTEKTF